MTVVRSVVCPTTVTSVWEASPRLPDGTGGNRGPILGLLIPLIKEFNRGPEEVVVKSTGYSC